MTLRKIVPMTFPETVPAEVSGARPKLVWVAPTSLLVDSTYQRDLSPTSVRLIRTIVAEFAWTRIKPPVAVAVGAGYHVIDGQHTAIAAATIRLPELPVFVVDAPEVLERARAFVSHNRNRLAITPLDIHRALVSSGDPFACTVARVCRECGVRLRYVTFGQRVDVGDTQCISHVQRLFKRDGEKQARITLTALVRARCAPIQEPQLLAAAALVRDSAVAPGRLTAAIRIGLDEDLGIARRAAAQQKLRVWRCLADIWLKRLRRQ